jgi:hypothetical protein
MICRQVSKGRCGIVASVILDGGRADVGVDVIGRDQGASEARAKRYLSVFTYPLIDMHDHDPDQTDVPHFNIHRYA